MYSSFLLCSVCSYLLLKSFVSGTSRFGLSSCIFLLLDGRLSVRYFGISCFISIAWPSLGIVEVSFLFPIYFISLFLNFLVRSLISFGHYITLCFFLLWYFRLLSQFINLVSFPIQLLGLLVLIISVKLPIGILNDNSADCLIATLTFSSIYFWEIAM